ncbi:MAG: amylo-alpha-1,6-glucosidase [Acidobacteriota bacterium]
MRTVPFCAAWVSTALAALLSAASAQAPHFTPIAQVSFDNSGPVLRAHSEPLKPFTVAGERGVLLGQQDGTFEAWVLPVKILSHLTIEADIEGYTVPIDVNQQSAEIEVHPDRTIITYSHIGFTVRQIMFSPNNAPAGTGPVVLFQFDCLHPTDFTFRFTPNLEYMWPERNEGHPSPEWVAPAPDAWERAGGFYVLHSDYPDLAAAITIPDARAGILAPYQERPQVHPVELKLHIDPAKDHGKLYPLLMAVGTNTAAANTHALQTTLENLNQSIAAEYAAHAQAYKDLLAHSVSIDTPDKSLNQAFQWAEISIEQLKAKPFVPQSPQQVGQGFKPANHAAQNNGASAPEDETALVAGYYASGDSARPGFGWFFGRDALYTLYAVNGYGDFALSKSELEFLIHRQRADGKIMHEYSQTAPAIDWLQFPYMYAAADSTPLFLLATLDYVRSSGDTAFLTAHRDAIEKAWQFETSHADTNGIYDNRQGTGWVESWPSGMPHQEIYLALLDQQASAAMGHIYELLGDARKATEATTRAQSIAVTIDKQFANGDKGCYAFSRNADGSLDRTTTVYPALAWWSDQSIFKPIFALDTLDAKDHSAGSILTHADQCLQQFASADLDTDWGLRDVSNKEPIYDGMSYHQGSVWPLFTGWAALAEYRGNQPLAGYRLLKQNADLTTAQDLGAVTELLSGDFFVPFGRSTSHQLWSSAMVITPTLRGLFGISIDAQTKTITVNPHLPEQWPNAEVKGLRTPDGTFNLSFYPQNDGLHVIYRAEGMQGWSLVTDVPGARHPDKDIRELILPLPAVDVNPQIITESDSPNPLPGTRTSIPRVIHEERGKNSLILVVEGQAESNATLVVIERTAKTKIKLNVSGGLSNHARTGEPGATLEHMYKGDGNDILNPPYPSMLSLHFPPGAGWQTITVTLTW